MFTCDLWLVPDCNDLIEPLVLPFLLFDESLREEAYTTIAYAWKDGRGKKERTAIGKPETARAGSSDEAKKYLAGGTVTTTSFNLYIIQ